MTNLNENVNYEEKEMNLCESNFQISNKKLNPEELLGIFEIVFKEIIDQQTLQSGVASYNTINVDGLVNEFLIDFEIFKNIIEDNSNYTNCKFYFLDNNKLNIGMAFSNHNEIELVANDRLYELVGEKFKLQDFSKNKEEYIKPDGLRDQIKLSNPIKEVTEMISYDSEVVRIYNFLVSHSYKVEKLKFKMFRFPSNYKKSDKADRISFAVNPVMTGLNDDQTNSFDAGDLKP